METAETKKSTFTVGELIYPAELEATFRVLSVGEHGIRIYRVSVKPIVPKAPYLVRFKGVLFKVVGWSGREFTIHHVEESEYIPE